MVHRPEEIPPHRPHLQIQGHNPPQVRKLWVGFSSWCCCWCRWIGHGHVPVREHTDAANVRERDFQWGVICGFTGTYYQHQALKDPLKTPSAPLCFMWSKACVPNLLSNYCSNRFPQAAPHKSTTQITALPTVQLLRRGHFSLQTWRWILRLLLCQMEFNGPRWIRRLWSFWLSFISCAGSKSRRYCMHFLDWAIATIDIWFCFLSHCIRSLSKPFFLIVGPQTLKGSQGPCNLLMVIWFRQYRQMIVY